MQASGVAGVAHGTEAPGATDAQLVAAVRAGDERAFEAVYDRHAAPLLSYCRHMLGSRHESEDALQQTFLKAYRALRSTEKAIKLRPWLYAIARNECISILRKRDERSLSIDDVESATDGLAATVEQREELRAMLLDISRLPEEQREALILTSCGALSGEEIARLIGCDRNKVKSLVFSARQSLAKTREARDTSCAEIRRQLSVLRGGSLRRRVLRDHLLSCEPCRAFRYDIRRQRQLVASLLPVIPAAALKALCVPGAASAAAASLPGQTAVATAGIGVGGGTAGVGAAAKVAGSVAGGSAAGFGMLSAGNGGGAVAAKGMLAMLGVVTALLSGAKLADRSPGHHVEGGGERAADAAAGEAGSGAGTLAHQGPGYLSTGADPAGSVRVILPVRREAGSRSKGGRRSTSAARKRSGRDRRGRKSGSREGGKAKGAAGRERPRGRGDSGRRPRPEGHPARGRASSRPPDPGASPAPPDGPPAQPGGQGTGPSPRAGGSRGSSSPSPSSGGSTGSSGSSRGRPAHAGRPPALAGNGASGGPPPQAGGGRGAPSGRAKSGK